MRKLLQLMMVPADQVRLNLCVPQAHVSAGGPPVPPVRPALDPRAADSEQQLCTTQGETGPPPTTPHSSPAHSR